MSHVKLDEFDVLWKQQKLLPFGLNVLLFHVFTESLPHDGNQHIQDGDLYQESCEDKVDSDKHLDRALFITQIDSLEVTKHHVVLVDEGCAHDAVTLIHWEQQAIFIWLIVHSAVLQDKERCGETKHQHRHHNHEVRNVLDRAQ